MCLLLHCLSEQYVSNEILKGFSYVSKTRASIFSAQGTISYTTCLRNEVKTQCKTMLTLQGKGNYTIDNSFTGQYIKSWKVRERTHYFPIPTEIRWRT